jgi:hypothetical protein
VSSGPWTELSWRSPTADPADTIAGHLLPFLAEEQAGGHILRALLLRELGREEYPRLALQVTTPGPARTDRDLGRRWRIAARDAGAVEVSDGPAVRPPLAGSGFEGPALGDRTRGFLAIVTPLVLPEAAGSDRVARIATALDLMAAHLPAVAASTVPGPRGGAPISFLSIRSHAEGFLASTGDPPAARRALDARFDCARDYIVERTAAVMSQMRGTGPEVSAAARTWFDAARATKPAVAADFRAARIRVVAGPRTTGGSLEGSSFHRLVHSSAGLGEFLDHDPGFLATRLLTSLLYLTFQTIGLSLMERYFLCHAVGRACEILFEVNANETLSSFERQHRHANLPQPGRMIPG